jgi:hypothetical protein
MCGEIVELRKGDHTAERIGLQSARSLLPLSFAGEPAGDTARNIFRTKSDTRIALFWVIPSVGEHWRISVHVL